MTSPPAEHYAENLYDMFLTLSWHFSSQCCGGVASEAFSLTDLLTLRIVEQEPQCAVQAVSRTLGISKSGASRIVKRLEEKGFLTTEPSPEDGRARRLVLTLEGTRNMALIARHHSERIGAVLQKMPQDVGAQLATNLQFFVDMIEDGRVESC
ncbi:MarR family winged helix-turn-helix transcriptional regulator [Flexibacterium corallicola]|uniref:MarR family winged helix-turn-helix transcriptional regulator n=1 Tax=Flexibacterium corallicola TaxID=3037259 RepID=UPI00286ED4C9|nr:MarR family transcriptional regulator [Pseudovibrio sp. M1P-2-3]